MAVFISWNSRDNTLEVISLFLALMRFYADEPANSQVGKGMVRIS
jgi:hypothetical protein